MLVLVFSIATSFIIGILVGRFFRRYEIEGTDYVMLDGTKITNPKQIKRNFKRKSKNYC